MGACRTPGQPGIQSQLCCMTQDRCPIAAGLVALCCLQAPAGSPPDVWCRLPGVVLEYMVWELRDLPEQQLKLVLVLAEAADNHMEFAARQQQEHQQLQQSHQELHQEHQQLQRSYQQLQQELAELRAMVQQQR